MAYVQHLWMEPYVCLRGFVPAVQGEGWGRRPEPPSPSRPLCWLDYLGCFLIVSSIWALSLEFRARGFLPDVEYSVVNALALILTRMRMLVMKTSPPPSSWTALALLPTCPAPALCTPPVCYEWEKPAATDPIVLPGSSGSVDSNRQSHQQDGDYNAAKKCFNSLLSDAAWTCDEQEDDYKAAMKCFDSLVRDAARICFVWIYDGIPPLTPQSDDPPPT